MIGINTIFALALAASSQVDIEEVYEIPSMPVAHMSFALGVLETAGQMCESYDTNEPFLNAIKEAYHEIYQVQYDMGVNAFVDMYDSDPDSEKACRFAFERYPKGLIKLP